MSMITDSQRFMKITGRIEMIGFSSRDAIIDRGPNFDGQRYWLFNWVPSVESHIRASWGKVVTANIGRDGYARWVKIEENENVA